MANDLDLSLITFVNGTVCNKCYAVMGERDGIVLSIRPLIIAEETQTLVGFRMRAMTKASVLHEFPPNDGAVEDIPKVKTAMDIPPLVDLPFDQKDETRCSLVGGSMLNVGYGNPKLLKESIISERTIGKFLMALQEHGKVPAIPELDKAVQAYFISYYHKKVDAMAEPMQVINSTKPVIDNPVVSMDVHKAKKDLSEYLALDDNSDKQIH